MRYYSLSLNKLLLFYVILLAIFTVGIPLSTIFRYYETYSIENLSMLVSVSLSSLFFVFAFLGFLINRNVSVGRSCVNGRLFFLFSLLSFCILVLFVLENSDSGLSDFSERYRQGEYKGSFLNTFLVIKVLPFILAFLLFRARFTLVYFLAVFFLVVASVLLGLRVFLLGFFVAFFLYFSQYRNIKLLLVFFLFFLVFFVGVKVYLNPERDILDILLSQLTRPDLHIIADPDIFKPDIFLMLKSLPLFNVVVGYEISAFKNEYFGGVENLKHYLPYVSNLNGIAMPGYVLLFNAFGVFSFPCLLFLELLIFLVLIAFFYLLDFSIWVSLVFLWVFLVLFSALIEDINILYNIYETPIIVFFSYFILRFIMRKDYV